MNLVGQCAASSCGEAIYFFSLLQELYNYFTSSTRRWQKLQSTIGGNLTLKTLSTTRWSSRDDACRSLLQSWNEIINTLQNIENDDTEKGISRSEAKGLRKRLQPLETAIMAVFWGSVMNRINSTSKTIQSVDMDISTIVGLYTSLIDYLHVIRDNFNDFEETAKVLTDADYEENEIRCRKRQLPFGENPEEFASVNYSNKFRTEM